MLFYFLFSTSGAVTFELFSVMLLLFKLGYVVHKVKYGVREFKLDKRPLNMSAYMNN